MVYKYTIMMATENDGKSMPSCHQFDQFKRCDQEAPEGLHTQAKVLNELIGDTCDEFMRHLRDMGLRANSSDLIYQVEAALYDYVKRSNPEHSLFPVAEGFGAAVDGPAAARVLANVKRDLDALRVLGMLE